MKIVNVAFGFVVAASLVFVVAGDDSIPAKLGLEGDGKDDGGLITMEEEDMLAPEDLEYLGEEEEEENKGLFSAFLDRLVGVTGEKEDPEEEEVVATSTRRLGGGGGRQCRANRRGCSRDNHCCSRNCDGGACYARNYNRRSNSRSNNNQCKRNGRRCSNDHHCCSGTCYNRQCGYNRRSTSYRSNSRSYGGKGGGKGGGSRYSRSGANYRSSRSYMAEEKVVPAIPDLEPTIADRLEREVEEEVPAIPDPEPTTTRDLVPLVEKEEAEAPGPTMITMDGESE